MIKGETVILIKKNKVDTNPFGESINEEIEIPVDNVLLGSPVFDGNASQLNLEGKKIAYTLAIPKGDTNNWKDTDVIIRGQRFKTVGFPLTQTPENVPTRWNTQVKVEAYE